MKNKRIQKLRAHWFSFKTNSFNQLGLRSGAKNGLIASIAYLFLLNPLIWLLFGHLIQATSSGRGLLILSTTFVFAIVAIPLFILMGTLIGFLITKTLEKRLSDWSQAKFVLRITLVALLLAILLMLLGAFLLFNPTQNESLFNLLLMWGAPVFTLFVMASLTAHIFYQRALRGDF